MNKKIGICLVGAAGRMGRAIVQEIAQSETVALVAAIESQNHPCLGQVALNGVIFSCDKASALKQCDVIIDFSVPTSTAEVIPFAMSFKKPLVCGVTGLPPDVNVKLEQAAEYIPVFYASNMARGIGAVEKAVRTIAGLTMYDVEIMEIHHAGKADLPSGTAITLGKAVTEARSYKQSAFYRSKARAQKDEVGISSLRGGREVGVHSVYFLGEYESIEVTYRVCSKAAFAKGAIEAAEYIVTQRNGLYSTVEP
ncbi:MAG: 4-hydroxy-tetrahydrodipicolinate reductase [Holosporales bacterium]|jgi:4-hydroxy-tetrahydrodipicolinate reductase|nr:4-hydroxy-tetrahydrodipicolinate reductase [Holosporales bacterium]